MSEQDRTPTRFHSKPHKDGAVVVDAWNDGTVIAICPQLDAAATLAMFLNGQEDLARQTRTALIKSLPIRK